MHCWVCKNCQILYTLDTLSKWRSSQYILNLSSWEIRPEKNSGLISQLLKLSIYCDDLHLLKMYFPQYKYMTFMYSYHKSNFVFLHYFVMWLAQKTCITFSTNQIQNKNQLWPNSLFALKGSFLFFTLSSHWLLVIFPPYDWLFYVVWVCFYITQLKSILFVGFFALLHSPLLYSTFLLCALPSSLFTLLALLHSMLCKRKRMPFTLPNPIRSKT